MPDLHNGQSDDDRLDEMVADELRHEDERPDDEALQFASYCPHCHTGDPGEDYCGSCGERL